MPRSSHILLSPSLLSSSSSAEEESKELSELSEPEPDRTLPPLVLISQFLGPIQSWAGYGRLETVLEALLNNEWIITQPPKALFGEDPAVAAARSFNCKLTM